MRFYQICLMLFLTCFIATSIAAPPPPPKIKISTTGKYVAPKSDIKENPWLYIKTFSEIDLVKNNKQEMGTTIPATATYQDNYALQYVTTPATPTETMILYTLKADSGGINCNSPAGQWVSVYPTMTVVPDSMGYMMPIQGPLTKVDRGRTRSGTLNTITNTKTKIYFWVEIYEQALWGPNKHCLKYKAWVFQRALQIPDLPSDVYTGGNQLIMDQW